MDTVSLLSFESHWVAIALCYLGFLLLLLITVVLCALVSGAPFLRENSTQSLFNRMLMVITGSTFLFAVYTAAGETYMIPMMFFAFSLLFLERDSIRKANGSWWEVSWLQRHQLVYLFVAGSLVFLLFLTLVVNLETGDLRYLNASQHTVFGVDNSFYVRAGVFLRDYGVELSGIDFYNPELKELEPYHWFELWFGALVYAAYPINAELLWCLLVNPVLFTLFLVGIAGLLIELTGSVALSYLVSFIALVLGPYGFLIPDGLGLISEFNESPTIFFSIKSVYCYLFAIPVVASVVTGRLYQTPFLLGLFGLAYLPILPVTLPMGLFIWGFLLFRNRMIEKRKIVLWLASAGLTILWFAWFYQSASVSYSPGEGSLMGILDGYSPLHALKILILYISRLFVTNIPVTVLLVLVWRFRRKRGGATISWRDGIVLLIAYYVISAAIFALFYKMMNGVQIFWNAYLSVHFILLSCLIGYGLIKGNTAIRVFAVALIALQLMFNFHPDLGAGNDTDKSELIRLKEYLLEQQGKEYRFAYVGAAGGASINANDENIFKGTTQILFPLKQLGLVVSPYISTSLSVMEIAPMKDSLENHVLRKMIAHASYFRYLHKNGLDGANNENVVRFIQDSRINYIVVPEWNVLPEDLRTMVSEPNTFFECEIYQVLDNQ